MSEFKCTLRLSHDGEHAVFAQDRKVTHPDWRPHLADPLEDMLAKEGVVFEHPPSSGRWLAALASKSDKLRRIANNLPFVLGPGVDFLVEKHLEARWHDDDAPITSEAGREAVEKALSDLDQGIVEAKKALRGAKAHLERLERERAEMAKLI